MSQARYLKNFWISWAHPHIEYNPGELRGMSRGETVLSINKRVQAFLPLTELITAKLRKRKCHLTPEVTNSKVLISNVESLYMGLFPQGKKKPYGMYASYCMDPLKLLDIPEGTNQIGELGITIVEDFLQTVKAFQYSVGEFPFDTFEEAINDFRACNMTTQLRPVTREIIGSSIKAEFLVKSTPSETAIFVTFRKGRKRYFTKQVGSQRVGLASNALSFADVTLGNDILEVNGVNFPPSTTIIKYSELPSELVEILNSENGEKA